MLVLLLRINSRQSSAGAAGENKSFKCFECGRSGHVRKNCYVFLKKNKNKYHNKFTANNAKVDRCVDEVIILSSSVSALSSVNSNNHFIIVSGATAHMCHSRNLFQDFSEVSNIKVQVGDGSSLCVEGKGEIFLKL